MNFRRFAWLALLALPALGAAQTFQDLTGFTGTGNGLYSTGSAWGDYDGDGDLDLYVANWGTAVSVPANALYENAGGGSFADVAAARGVANTGNSLSPVWADYDNDGDPDLYVADFYAQDYLYENREGNFTEVGRARGIVNLIRQGSVTSVTWGDYDNDGFADFYLGKYYYDNELYRNVGDGTFRPVQDLGLGDRRDTADATWIDYDNDGDLDLYLVNREQENALYRNDLDERGDFTEIGQQAGLASVEIGQCAAWADYDNDGDPDLYLGNVGANILYRNDGGDRFTDVAETAGVRQTGVGWITAGAAWGDYDGDGDFDLYLANGGDRQGQPDALLANDGDGTFTDATSAAGMAVGGTPHMSAAWGDYDGNGAPDLYLTNGWGPFGPGNRLFENGTPGSSFIRVRVRGLGPQDGGASFDAFGAQVRLLEGETGILRAYQQSSGSGDLIFGAPAGPYTVEVRFPGRTTPVTVADVRGGDRVTVEEPEL